MHLLQRAALLALLVAIAAYICSSIVQFHFVDYDLWARIAVGRLFFTTGAVPLHDVFSFSPTKAIWYDHEWLAGVLFYSFLALGGASALLWCALAAAVTTFAVLYRLQQRLCAAPIVGALLLFVAAQLSVGMWAAVVRSQIFSFLLFAVVAYLLHQGRSGKKVLPALGVPLSFVIWVNAHGGVIVGFGLLGLTLAVAWLEQRPERNLLLLLTAASLLVLLLNPYGVGYLGFLFEAIGKDRPLIDEWKALPLNPIEIIRSGNSGVLLFGLLVCIGSVSHRRSIAKEHIAFTWFALVYGASHLRLLPFFYCAAATFFLPVVAGIGQRFRLRSEVRTVSLLLALPAMCYSLWLLTQRLSEVSRNGLVLSPYPVEAMHWLHCNYPGGKILSSFNTGSFVLWRGYPHFLVAVDGRYEEVYEDEIVRLVQIALSSVHPDRVAARERINPDFIVRCGSEASGPAGEPWRIVYDDGRCLIEAKAEPAPTIRCADDAVWQPYF